MAEICHRYDDLCVGISANDRWNTLLQLTGILSEGKAVLEELVGEIESRNDFLDPLDRGFLKKRKRSPRNFKKPNKIDHQEHVIFKKPVSDNQTPETSSGGECHQSPKSTLCRYRDFEIPIKKRPLHINYPINSDKKKRKRGCLEFDEEISSTSWEKSKRRGLQLIDRHIIIDTIPSLMQPSLPEGIRSRIIETGGRFEGAVCVIEKVLYPTDVDSGECRLSVPIRQVRERFLFPDEAEMLMAHSGGGIRTTLIQPCLEECEITFALWESNTMYVLKKGWNNVYIKNGLRHGMQIRLWAFRRNLELCFALEVLG